MKNTVLSGMAFLIAAALCQSLRAADPVPTSAPTTQKVDPNKVIITFGDHKVTVGEWEAIISDLPADTQQAAMGPQKRMMAMELVEMKLMGNAAKAQKLDSSDKVKRELQMAEDQILASALSEAVTKSIDDAAIKAYMDSHASEFDQVTARHILIRTPNSQVPVGQGKKELTDAEAKAKIDDIKKRLDKGEDFAAIAKAESDDTFSAVKGGDLPPFGHGEMIPEFEAAAFAMKDNEISQPVKTDFGWHIIQVQSHKPPTVADVRDKVAPKLAKEKMDAMMADLKKTANPQLDTGYFGEEPKPVTMPMMPPTSKP